MMLSVQPTLWSLTGRNPREIAVEDDRRQVTWQELEDRTNAIAHGLTRLGAKPGDHVSIVVSNRVEFVEVFLGAWRAGLAHSPLKTGWTAREIGQVLDDANSKVVICDRPAAAEAARERGIPVLKLDVGFDEWVSGQPIDPLPADRCGYRIPFTSGTSGRPKGVVRTEAGRTPFAEGFRALAGWAQVALLPGEGTHLFVSRLFHGTPLNFGLGAFARGARLRIMPRWDAAEALAAMAAPELTSTIMVPTMFRALLALPGVDRSKPPAPGLQTIFHGGEACPISVKQAMLDWFGDVLVEYYGFTEGGLTVADSAEWRDRPGTVGKPFGALTLHILDDRGHPLPAGETGTVAFGVGGRTFSYLSDPTKTEDAFVALDGQDLVSVGDVGRLDTDGYLYLSGRSADVVISAGVNIYPAEIEDALSGVEGIADVCATGTPDPDRGEVIILHIVLDEHADETAVRAALEQRAAESLAPYKRPARTVVLPTLPRDPGTGKLLRAAVRDHSEG
jgi:long-chain acyl-CoA synthetase